MPLTMLVGAYERDNFGDLLFYTETARYLEGREIVATAPFAADMSDSLGIRVEPYAEVLRRGQVDTVWVVGGEVGGTSARDAFRMSSTADAYAAWESRSHSNRRSELQRVLGRPWYSSPYMPRAVRGDAGVRRYVINSVGLSGAGRIIGRRQIEVQRALRGASYLSVRDRASSRMLRVMGIRHTLAPDLVHSIASTMPIGQPDEPDVALIQFKSHFLRQIGPESFARSLVESTALDPYRLRFFSAGSATGHDSVELYREIAAEVARLSPGRDVEISTASSPHEKAAEIGNCGLWIGTSLHGLIISTAYGVPHVALEIPKLTTYMDTWSDRMPAGVPMMEIDGAVSRSLEIASRSKDLDRGQELADRAIANVIAARSEAPSPVERTASEHP